MDCSELVNGELYDATFDDIVALAKTNPDIAACIIWELLWGPIDERVVNEIDCEVIDDTGAVVPRLRYNQS